MKELTTKIHFRYISQFLEGIASDSHFEKKKRRAERFFGELNKYKQTFVEENGSNCVSFVILFFLFLYNPVFIDAEFIVVSCYKIVVIGRRT